uniref:Cytochrome c oxidase subunit 3 n=1 Tax=Kokeshia sp. NKU02 TaxID=1124182 RepID=A0A0X7YHD2_9HEMI|nr:cytochrome c oxidase subunit III [Kokeshia sp. NKU02]
MKKKNNHPFHLVEKSPWPIMMSISIMTFMMGFIAWLQMDSSMLMIIGMMITMLTSMVWWRDVIRESTFQGHHTILVNMGLKWGMILFIMSEVMFFLSFFRTFFHSSLSPNIELGMKWPPMNIETFNPMQIPLLNTIILLSSGLSVTWAHHSIIENNHTQALQSLMITVILGIYFTMLQMMEYKESSFTITDSTYGSVFFMATGFHGIHVIIGTVFLTVCLYRHLKNHFSNMHHTGFEMATWYWHFVDVVWLFLYISIYWWSK